MLRLAEEADNGVTVTLSLFKLHSRLIVPKLLGDSD